MKNYCRFSVAIGTGLLLICALAQADTNIATTVSNIYTIPFSLTAASPVDTLVVSVPGSDKVVVGIESGGTPLDIVVTDPSGTPLDASFIERYSIAPGEEPPLGVVLFGAGEHITFSVDNPTPGDWNVELALPGGAADVDGALTRIALGGLSSRLLTSRATYREDQDVVLSMLVFNGTAPVSGAAVTADVFTESSVLVPDYSGIVLRDDGVSPDAMSGDGVYTAALNGLAPGHYFAQANITTGGDTAVGTARFDVISTLATFTGALSDAGVDDNGDGLVDRIVLLFDLTVIQPGDYAAIASLSKNGKTVNAGTTATLDETATGIEIAFPADDIRDFLGENGPYDIADVQLVRRATEADGADIVADHLVDLGQTGAYQLADLQRPITVIPEGLTENAVDNDGNGLYDSLVVRLTIDTLTPSSYIWSGDLRAADGMVLGVANNRANLASGANIVTLTFDGHDIGRGGVNGPYQIANIAAYGNNGGANVRDLLGETGLYLASEFEGFSANALCDVDADGDIDKADLSLISRSRNQPASGPNDPRDANGDGIITVADVLVCTKQCTREGCATQ